MIDSIRLVKQLPELGCTKEYVIRFDDNDIPFTLGIWTESPGFNPRNVNYPKDTLVLEI